MQRKQYTQEQMSDWYAKSVKTIQWQHTYFSMFAQIITTKVLVVCNYWFEECPSSQFPRILLSSKKISDPQSGVFILVAGFTSHFDYLEMCDKSIRGEYFCFCRQLKGRRYHTSNKSKHFSRNCAVRNQTCAIKIDFVVNQSQLLLKVSSPTTSTFYQQGLKNDVFLQKNNGQVCCTIALPLNITSQVPDCTCSSTF